MPKMPQPGGGARTAKPAKADKQPEIRFIELDRMLRPPAVVDVTGIPYSSIRDMMDDGRFPLPCDLGGRRIGWPASEIQEWIKTSPKVGASTLGDMEGAAA